MALFDSLSPRSSHIVRVALVWAVVLVTLTSPVHAYLGEGEPDWLLHLPIALVCHFAGGLFMGWLDWYGRIELKRRADRPRRA